jgi:Zn finger protein HypA/HybF involved in hydrogenase expression
MSVVSDNYLAILDGPEITENIFCFKCDTCNAPSAWEKNEDRCPNCQSILGHLIKCGDEESLKIGLRITTRTQRVIAEAMARQVQ